MAPRDCCQVLLPHLSPLVIDSVGRVDDALVVAAHGRSRGSRCHRCGRVSTRVHSRYRRRVADLPVSGRPVACQRRQWVQRVRSPRCQRLLSGWSERTVSGLLPSGHRVQARLNQQGRTFPLRHSGVPVQQRGSIPSIPVWSLTELIMEQMDGSRRRFGADSLTSARPQSLAGSDLPGVPHPSQCAAGTAR